MHTLTPNEDDQFFNSILQQKFDQELKDKWSKTIADQYQISKNHSKIENKKWNVRNLILFSSSIAASVLFLVVWQYGLYGNQMNSQEFALLELDEKLIHPGGVRGDISDELIKQNAIQDFNAQDYAAAILHFNQMESTNIEDQFYLGLSYLYNKDYSKSVSTFENIQSGSALDQEVNWYLSLAYLLNGNDQLAKDKLNGFGEKEWKATEAKKLLQTIKHN